jgi:methyl-accepting chemotaxis protein
MGPSSIFEGLLHFLEIDETGKAHARRLGQFLEPHLDAIIEKFYAKVVAVRINPHVNSGTAGDLKLRQKRHWRALFETDFSEDFLDGIRRIGIKHTQIDLNPMWYIAGYAMLKIEFTNVIVKSNHPIEEKGHLIKILDKYVAVDMALSLSTTQAAFVD